MFIPVLSLALISPCLAQPGWRQNDIITYTDSRNVRCAAYGYREVFFATDGGVARLDRASGEMLEPWSTGVGYGQAVPLTDGKVILWHRNSGTLYLAGENGLKCCRSDRQIWESIEDARLGKIASLGETRDLLWVDSGGKEFLTIDPFTQMVTGERDTAGANIRWSGRRGWAPHEFPPYNPTDPMTFFHTEDGSITDRANQTYQPVYDLSDDYSQRIYICYPGLGIGVADVRSHNLEIVQPGPAKPDVKAISLGRDGAIWIGGEGDAANGGFSLFNRGVNRWERFDRDLEFGLESDEARACVVYGDSPYFGTDAGMVYRNPAVHGWTTLGRFDGLLGPGIGAMASAGGYLYIGGERGVNIVQLPGGPVFKAGDDRLNDLRTADIASDGDTVWIAGLQGVYKGTGEGDWKALSGETVVGDEPARCITVDRNHVWIGGSRGIRRYDRHTAEWIGYLNSVYLRGAKPLALASSDSLLWIGSDAGLYGFNYRRGSWIKIGVDQGLPSLRIQRLIVEADTLWIGTPKGLTRLLWNRPERDGW